jgi:predicted enzyme related to lactoylglutathione lyase
VPSDDPTTRRGRITGIGGVFFRSRDRKALAEWYHDVLGLPTTDAATAKMGQTVWAAFDAESPYFPTTQEHMVNYRVDDLRAALTHLREAGATVAPEIQRDDYGDFAWAVDPEGNRFELWQPNLAAEPLADPPA